MQLLLAGLLVDFTYNKARLFPHVDGPVYFSHE